MIEWKILRLYLNRPYIYTEKETQVQAIDTTYLPIPLHMSANFSNAVYSSFLARKVNWYTAKKYSWDWPRNGDFDAAAEQRKNRGDDERIFQIACNQSLEYFLYISPISCPRRVILLKLLRPPWTLNSSYRPMKHLNWMDPVFHVTVGLDVHTNNASGQSCYQ